MKKRRLKMGPIIVLIVIIFVVCLVNILSSLKPKNQTEVKVINFIEKYDYNLNENETSYYKGLFKELKSTLNKDKVDEERYATLISKMFLADFFSLKNAINKNDIGGTDFIYSNYKDDFISKAKDTVYQYVENNIYGNRKQELPIVKEVKINNIEQREYSGDKESDDNAYYVEANIVYEKDSGYQKKCELILIHSNDKLEIVIMK